MVNYAQRLNRNQYSTYCMVSKHILKVFCTNRTCTFYPLLSDLMLRNVDKRLLLPRYKNLGKYTLSNYFELGSLLILAVHQMNSFDARFLT